MINIHILPQPQLEANGSNPCRLLLLQTRGGGLLRIKTPLMTMLLEKCPQKNLFVIMERREMHGITAETFSSKEVMT